MSLSAVLALRKAMRARLAADPELTSRVTGFFDEAPAGAVHPYVAFGDAQARDWSALLSPGVEQFIVLHVWTTQRGLAGALAIAQRLKAALDEAPLAVEGHRLVDLRFLSLETRRDNAGRFARASLRFRATLEILE
jgi:hypothetical protein